MPEKKLKRLAVLTSHAIQYQTPLFRKLSENREIDLMVYFCWDTRKRVYDTEFQKEIKWDIPLYEGYAYRFLKNFSFKPSSQFWGQINPGIFKEISKENYDAILVFGWNSFSKMIAFVAAFLFGVPVLLFGENPLNQELLKNSLKLKLKKILFSWLFGKIKFFLYIGEENKKFYEYYGVPEEKLIFCPYAVDNEKFIAQAEELISQKNKFKSDFGISREKAAILFVAKLIEKKRPFDLISAYGKVENKNKALVFVGEGPLRKKMEDFVAEKNISDVYFLGFKNQTEMPKYYALSDIFVLPSGEGETWGLAVNEAMCFSLPVIVSDLAGCSADLVKNNMNGYVFPVGDVQKLTYYLEMLINDKEMRRVFGEKSSEIIKNYSYKEDVESILKALRFLK